MLTEKEIVSIVSSQIINAEGYDTDVLSTLRANALDYYQGNMPQPAEGRSDIVSTDLANAVHSLMAQIQPILKTTTIEFIPESEQDEPQAQMESTVVRQQLDRCEGFDTIFNAAHDALLTANGWVKVYADEETKVTEEKYTKDISPEGLLLISMPTKPNQTVEIKEQGDFLRVIRSTTTTTLDFDCIPPESILFNNADDRHELSFVAELKLMTVSELLEEGFSKEKVTQIPNYAYDNTAANARLGIYQYDNQTQPDQEAEQLKPIYCCYTKLDLNNSGKSELRYIWLGGDTLLKNEPADFIPYISGCAIPMPHRVQGVSLYEVLQSIQAGKTHILRNYMDNLSVLNQSRIGAVEGQVNMQDLTNGRLNGVVRLRSPDALIPLPSTDIGPQSIAGLNYLDDLATQRVGSAMDFNDVQAQLMSSSATAAAGQMAQVEKMAGWYANNLVNTLLKPAFLLAHKVMRTSGIDPVMTKINNKYQEVNPKDWQERYVVETNMGLTSMEKAQRVNGLNTVITMQRLILDSGGRDILTNLSRVYNAVSDYVRAVDLGDPDSYFIDPDTPQSLEAQQYAEQKDELEKQRLKRDAKEIESLKHEYALLLQQQKLAFEKWKTTVETEYDYSKLRQEGEIAEAELTTEILTNDKGAHTTKELN